MDKKAEFLHKISLKGQTWLTLNYPNISKEQAQFILNNFVEVHEKEFDEVQFITGSAQEYVL